MSLSNSYILGLAGLAVVFVIYRQFVPRRISSTRRAMLVPVILVALGAANLSHDGGVDVLDLATVAAGVVIGIVLGVIRGSTTQIWRDEQGLAWQRGSVALAALWVLSVAARLALGFEGSSLGVSQAANLAEIPIFFGVTLLAQNASVLVRAHEGLREARGGPNS